jgi:hypothetical protein
VSEFQHIGLNFRGWSTNGAVPHSTLMGSHFSLVWFWKATLSFGYLTFLASHGKNAHPLIVDGVTDANHSHANTMTDKLPTPN